MRTTKRPERRCVLCKSPRQMWIGFWEKLFLQKRRSKRKMGVDAHFSDLQNRVAAGIFQRFQNTNQCSAGLGAAPQQAEGAHFHRSGKEPLCAYVLHMHCLPSVTSQTRLLLFNKCLWLYKQKIKSHHSSARSAISLASLTASASRSLFSSPVFCSMFATWNWTVDISQPISAAMRV